MTFAPARVTPRAILVVVPTTGGPLWLRTLKVRPGLPASAAFADGDYRPLPWSADYARLCATGGPLSGIAGDVAAPYELRLSGSFDAGRSWEAPVCLAHGLVARGHRLATAPAEADLVLWATGAVDLDLAILPGDYALLDKIERSRALLAQAPGAALAVLLPEGPERGAAEAAIRALGRAEPPRLLAPDTVAAALDALARPAEPAAPSPAPWRRLALPAGAVALAGLAALLLGLRQTPSAMPPGPSASETPAPETPAPEIPAPESPAPEPVVAAPPPSAVTVEELRAPAGSSCRRVAFGADPPVRHPVRAEDGERLAPSRLAPDLCGLAVRASAPGLRVEVGSALRAAALPPVRLADGAQAYFLREGARRNLVYAVQVTDEAGESPPGGRRVHALVP